MLVSFWFQIFSIAFTRSFHPFPHGTLVLYACREDHFGPLRRVPYCIKQSDEPSFYIKRPFPKYKLTGVAPSMFVLYSVTAIRVRSPLLTESRLIYSLSVT